jgi:hypothetical protein
MDIQRFISNGIGPSTPIQRTSFFTCQIDLSPFLLSWGPEYTKDMSAVQSVLQQGLVCANVTLPSREFQTTDLNIYGVEEKYPILSTFTDLSCEFLTPLSRNAGRWRNSIAASFHHWQDFIQGTTPTTSSPYIETEGESVPEIRNLNFKFPDSYRLKTGFTIAQYAPQSGTAPGGQNASPRVDQFASSASSDTTFRADVRAAAYPFTPTLVYHFYNVYPVRVESSALDWSDSDQMQRVRVSFAYTHWTTNKQMGSTALPNNTNLNKLPLGVQFDKLPAPPPPIRDNTLPLAVQGTTLPTPE